jgi:ABC-type glycerol-3-phosphate transport system substrate-binding protein
MHAIAKEHLVIEKIHSTERAREGAVWRRTRRRGRRRAALASTVLIATSATLALAACGGTAASSGSTSSSGVVNLSWQTMWSGNTLTLLSQMVNAFNSSHPGIHVTESNIPSATGDAKLLSEIAAGDPPDVSSVSTRRTARSSRWPLT